MDDELRAALTTIADRVGAVGAAVAARWNSDPEAPDLLPPLTAADLRRIDGDLQRRRLRDLLGDRLIGSPIVEPGQAFIVAPDGYTVPPSGDHIADGAEALKAGGVLIVSKEWLDGP